MAEDSARALLLGQELAPSREDQAKAIGSPGSQGRKAEEKKKNGGIVNTSFADC
jgi:hypothetical protein